MKSEIEKLAKEVVYDILKIYKSNKWGKQKLEEFVKEKLKNYSEEVKKIIEDELEKTLGGFYYTNTNPEIAATPVLLSEMLYKNAVNTAKKVGKILYDAVKEKETIGVIAKKLYEGYGFKDKEILEPLKVLPKYLQEAIKKKDKSIIKQIEKLKTKPLRIVYKDIIRRLDELSDEALQKYIKTAYYEKIRYYASRIADTETHRAMMSKRAYEYLSDENVEFVKFTMSSAHPKIDICDFYANLDIGYGRGIVPKKEMRSLPLHVHCHCVYAPYYGKVKGKKKDWKKAVKETMSRYSEREQREILGTYDMLNRFKAGEDIERIFNTIRPKYPIRKYSDLFKGVNSDDINIMKYKSLKEAAKEEIENKILDKISKIENVKNDFYKLWMDKKSFENHIDKRLKEGHIKDADDYILKTLDCIVEADEYILAIHDKSWNNLCYNKKSNWAVIFNEHGEIMTSYQIELDKKSFEKLHKEIGGKIKKGEVNEKIRKAFERLRDRYKNLE